MNNITYAISEDDGMVVSRVGGEIAYPVLEYERIGRGEDSRGPMEYRLDKSSVFGFPGWGALTWTKKIPAEIKNRHRAFWGFKPVR